MDENVIFSNDGFICVFGKNKGAIFTEMA